MDHGIPGRARRRLTAAARKKIRSRPGGCTFAERPDLAAPQARIIWRAELDPGTLEVVAETTDAADPDGIDRCRLDPWFTSVASRDGREHAVLSDGWHRVRLDIVGAPFETGRPMLLHYRLSGVKNALPKLLSLRRLIDLIRRRRFSTLLFPVDRRMPRALLLLRVGDALATGASHRDIAIVLFGAQRVCDEWNGRSDSLRSAVRRLVVDARVMAAGGYRRLLFRSGTDHN